MAGSAGANLQPGRLGCLPSGMNTTSTEIAVDARPAAVSGTLETPLERRIEPVKSRLKFADLYRDLPVVRVLAARDFKVKYKQSVLGPIWLIFQPVALLAAFLVAFRGLAGIETSGVPYVVFALVGLSVWAFFQASMTIGTASLVTSYLLVRLTPCPRLAFPIASLVASLPAMGVTTLAAFGAAAVTGTLSPRVLLLPIGIAWAFLFCIAVVAISSAITVRARDLVAAMPFLLQVGVFVTPVGYPPQELSPTVRLFVDLNPLTGIIDFWRWLFLSGQGLDAFPVLAAVGSTVILALLGWRVFSRFEVTMADDI
jgi:lipopolysaccharide transport system permease protein